MLHKWAHVLFRTICIEYKLASIEYFLDYMEEYEAMDCISMLEYADRTTKELTRYQLLVSINSMSKRKWEPSEIMKLPWDDRWHDKIENGYKEDEAKYLEEQSSDMEDMLNSGMFGFKGQDMVGELNKNISDNKK